MRSSVFVNWISIRFYEMDCIVQKGWMHRGKTIVWSIFGSRLGKQKKSSFLNCRVFKGGGGVKALPLRKKTCFFAASLN